MSQPEVNIPSHWNQLTGKPWPAPTDYSYGGLSPDIAIVMARKTLTNDEHYFINFGTSPKGEK